MLPVPKFIVPRGSSPLPGSTGSGVAPDGGTIAGQQSAIGSVTDPPVGDANRGQAQSVPDPGGFGTTASAPDRKSGKKNPTITITRPEGTRDNYDTLQVNN